MHSPFTIFADGIAGRSVARRRSGGGGRKVRATQGTILPNGKWAVRFTQAQKKITARVLLRG